MTHATPNKKTIFESILDGEIPAEYIYEDDEVVVIDDKYPKAPVHILIISKKHIPSLKEAQETDEKLLGHMIMVANRMARQKKCDGYRLQFNVGSKGGQVIFHLHLHLMGWL